MTIQYRLRQAARFTRLDADKELLTEAADALDRLSASAALPTLRPGDSHMESLIEAAIQGHASTRDAMRWLVRQLVPAAQPADVTDEQIIAIKKSIRAVDPTQSWGDTLAFARAILALRPAQVPMTDEQIRSMCKQGWVFETVKQWVSVIEAHHGITAQAKKETP